MLKGLIATWIALVGSVTIAITTMCCTPKPATTPQGAPTTAESQQKSVAAEIFITKAHELASNNKLTIHQDNNKGFVCSQELTDPTTQPKLVDGRPISRIVWMIDQNQITLHLFVNYQRMTIVDNDMNDVVDETIWEKESSIDECGGNNKDNPLCQEGQQIFKRFNTPRETYP